MANHSEEIENKSNTTGQLVELNTSGWLVPRRVIPKKGLMNVAWKMWLV